MTRAERRRLLKNAVLPVLNKMLLELEQRGDSPPADVWVSEDVVLKLEMIKVV